MPYNPPLADRPDNDDPIARTAPCDLCGGGLFEEIAQLDRRGNPLATVICVGCGLIAHRSIPSEAELAHYYAKKYRSDYHGEITPSPHRVIRAWRTGRQILTRLQPHLHRNDRVFEVGAGIGCNVKVFDLAGHDASGIEPGEGFHAFSRDQLCTRIEKINLADVPRRPAYDVVLLIHVIEHFRSPRTALAHIHSILKAGGRLYVECPNVAAPHAAPGKLFHMAHIHNFTPQTLVMMAAACGFDVQCRNSDDRGRDLMFLFTRAGAGRLHVDLDSCRRTIGAIGRYNTLSYHLRWRYLTRRVGTVAAHFSDHVRAKQRVARIVDACKRHTGQSADPELHDRAA